jgi:hypothetical protein
MLEALSTAAPSMMVSRHVEETATDAQNGLNSDQLKDALEKLRAREFNAFYVTNIDPLTIRGVTAPEAENLASDWAILRLTPQENVERSPIVRKSANIRNTLRRYRLLPDNWDGEGGVPPSSDIVEMAIAFLDGLPPNLDLPRPMVEGEGEITLLWKSPNIYLEIGFLGGDHISYYGQHGTSELVGEETFDGIHFNTELLNLIRKY